RINGNLQSVAVLWQTLGMEQRSDEVVEIVDLLKRGESWQESEGKYVPKPERFLSEFESRKAVVGSLEDAKKVLVLYLSVTGQPKSINELTPARSKMLSEAYAKARQRMGDGTEAAALEFIEDAIK